PTVLIAFTLTFLVVHATPGSPWDESEKPLPESVKQNLRKQYHLDDPLPKQYFDYLASALHGDFGPSYRNVRSVSDIIQDDLPVSIQLGLASLLFALVVGIPLGTLTAMVVRHALKNALIPVVTVIGFTLANVITGAFFVERIYDVPGIGRQFVDSVSGRDYPLLLGIVLLFALIISFMNLLVDLSY